MLMLLLGWAGLLSALIAMVVSRPRNGGALTLAYFLGLSLIHVPGLLPFIGSRFVLRDAAATHAGFEVTLLGTAAFIVGVAIARRQESRRGAGPVLPATRQRGEALARVGRRVFTLGVGAYLILIPISFLVPSLNSLASALATLLIVGLWLILYSAAITGDRTRIAVVLALLPFLPLATLITSGLLGYGVYWILSIIAFLFIVVRNRTLFYVGAPFAVYLGLSFFVTYMGERAGIRDLVWREHASLADRLARSSTIVTEFEPIDLNSPAHVTALDERLNQSSFVGLAVFRHEEGLADFAYGATVPYWALIPRAIWPEKPTVGGGLDVVSEFTGLTFAAGTSVGAGQVFEFYVNFGIPGVVVGFGLLGFALMRLDCGIMRALASDDRNGFLLRALPGLTLLQPGGNLLEIIVATVGALFVAYGVIRLKLLDVSPPPRRGATGVLKLRRDA